MYVCIVMADIVFFVQNFQNLTLLLVFLRSIRVQCYLPRMQFTRAHCYCASLVRTQYMTWRLPCHVFQARAPSRNSTKYRADELCANLISEYFCWMLGDPHFFFGRSLPFLILSNILKNKKNLCVGSFNYFSYTVQIRLNLYMDTGVHDLEVTFFKANST